MKTIRNLIVIACMSWSVVNIHAQENQPQTRTSPFQLTFITPLGTHGMESGAFTNNFSINLIGGYAGGLDGVELSGIIGLLKTNMKGVQFAGFGNTVLGEGMGAQFSGFYNFSKQHFNGVQFAGFANVITDDSKVLQFAGFTNVIKGDMTGAQFAGFANYVSGENDGVQLAGFGNLSSGNLSGQVSGFMNLNLGYLKGVQIAGFANVNTEKVEGVQVAGFLNVAKKLDGVQIGVFNFVDSLERGVSIGVFSFIKNGYRAFELSTSETLYGTVSFKTGTKQFYNIISAGATVRDNMILWGWGYGLGTTLEFSDKFGMDIEGICYHINEDEWFTNRLNLLNKLQVTASWKVFGNMAIFGGPAWNVVVADVKDKDGHDVEISIAPWSVFDKIYNDRTRVKMYPGFTLGMRF